MDVPSNQTNKTPKLIMKLDSTNSVIRTVSTLGFDLPVNVPSDLATFDAIFGEGTALRMAVTHVIFHQRNHEFRAALVDAIVDETKLEVPTIGDTKKTISEEKYLAWVQTQVNADGEPVITPERVAEIAVAVNAELGDLSPRESKRGEGKRSAEVTERGTAKFNEVASGKVDLADFVAKWEAINPTGKRFSELGEASDVNTFITAYHLNALRVKREAEAAAKAANASL